MQIINIECPQCSRRFRTVPSVIGHTGAVYCSQCGSRMNISDPLPVSILSKASKANAA